MTTIAHVLDVFLEVNRLRHTLPAGESEEFWHNFHCRFWAVRLAVSREHAVAIYAVLGLNPETVLGREAERRLSDLQQWLTEQRNSRAQSPAVF